MVLLLLHCNIRRPLTGCGQFGYTNHHIDYRQKYIVVVSIGMWEERPAARVLFTFLKDVHSEKAEERGRCRPIAM